MLQILFPALSPHYGGLDFAGTVQDGQVFLVIILTQALLAVGDLHNRPKLVNGKQVCLDLS